jgi:ATP-dependent DNA ligase
VDGAAGRWLKPALVGQFEFVESAEWTSDLHLRHARFIALREDKRRKDEGIKPNCSL